PRFGCGRRYPEEPSEEFWTNKDGDKVRNEKYGKYWGNLTIHSKFIKNTIFTFMGWADFDQVKGHPTLLAEIGKNNGIHLTAYEEYIQDGGFEKWCAILIPYYSVEGKPPLEEKDIKLLFNKTIYGGGHPRWCSCITFDGLSKDELEEMERKGISKREMKNTKSPHPLYLRFATDTKTITKPIWDNNQELRDIICKDMIDDSAEPFSKCRNKLMSAVCGTIENELTFQAYKYCCDVGLSEKKHGSWGYDGLTIKPLSTDIDLVKHGEAMTSYVREKTGFKMVRFKNKTFKPKDTIQSVLEARRNLIPEPIVIADDHSILTTSTTSTERDEYYVNWKLNFEKEWCKIINTASFIRVVVDESGAFVKYIIQTQMQLKTAYGHETYEKGEGKKMKRIKCINEWLEDSSMRCYDDANMYPPPKICPSNHFNLWRPSPFENTWDSTVEGNEYESDEEGVRMFCGHLQLLCDHEQEVYDYVSCWIAHMFKKPAEKSTHFTLISEEGAGKGVFFDVLSQLLGHAKVLTTSSPERDVWGSFNSLM
ncbi:hypothetical protein B484DRAFT_439802, partial [Ochromonadaceae sp. CCMP2298]